MKMKSSGLRRLRLKKLLGGGEVYGVRSYPLILLQKKSH